jgi:hypothetical protein
VRSRSLPVGESPLYGSVWKRILSACGLGGRASVVRKEQSGPNPEIHLGSQEACETETMVTIDVSVPLWQCKFNFLRSRGAFGATQAPRPCPGTHWNTPGEQEYSATPVQDAQTTKVNPVKGTISWASKPFAFRDSVVVAPPKLMDRSSSNRAPMLSPYSRSPPHFEEQSIS